jgi:hypothetical protein
LSVHGENLVLPRSVPASGTLEGLLKPIVPAAETGHVFALGDIEVVRLIADATQNLLIFYDHG